MKKSQVLLLACIATLFSSFIPFKLSSVKINHSSVVKKVSCASSFNVDVSCGPGGNLQVLYVYIAGVDTWAPFASCNSSVYLGSKAFNAGTYTVKLYLGSSGGPLIGGGGYIYLAGSGVVASWSDSDVDPSSLEVTLSSVYLIGCGHDYTIYVYG